MGKEQGFLEGGPFAGRHAGRAGHAGQRAQPVAGLLIEGEGHKRGPGGLHRQAKLLRDLIGKPRGPHLWDRFAARG